MYELARWTENHDAELAEVVFWPFPPDLLRGYARLERAASLDYPPAVYAQGVRLKYGQHVPRPADWNGPSGNNFPQPARGQELIEKAIKLGYKPTVPEDRFYPDLYLRR